jgi:hypothetical protein
VAERAAQLLAGRLELPPDTAHSARPGVLAQGVDHRPANAPFGEGLELDPARLVEPFGGVDEADDTVLHKIAEVDRVRHGGSHAAREGLHKRQASFYSRILLLE